MIPPTLTIRQATEADYEQLCDLFAELDLQHREARPDLFHKPKGPIRERSYVAGLIGGPESAIFVASERDARVLHGLATVVTRMMPTSLVKPERRIAEVDNLVVHRQARRMGVGRALIGQTRDWAERKGFGTLELAVYEFNDEAIAFYEAMGFATAQRRMALSCAS